VVSACAFACADPATTLFWDGIHPTTAGHFLLAQQALLLVPEPGTVPLALFAGLWMLAALRRRRQC
jgi:outer membrane lipase/esterase